MGVRLIRTAGRLSLGQYQINLIARKIKYGKAFLPN